MLAATTPVQRPADAKLLVVDSFGAVTDARRSTFVDWLRPGDVVVANDAATLPASLSGRHVRTSSEIEIRLAGRGSLSPDDVHSFAAVVFGAGDFHTPTERRPLPPALAAGDRLALGPLDATVTRLLDHPRLASIAFDGSADAIWAGIARHGRPIQYAHLPIALSLWDVWTSIAGRPVAFEPPSAGFVLDWHTLHDMRERGIEFFTITHAAGISSTGDDALDARLPLDEPYEIPRATATAINRALANRRRIVAIGTTVVRALEHAATGWRTIRAGRGVATGRITAATRLRIVDAVLSGVHEPTTSHYQLLGAFAGADTLRRADEAMNALGYRTHEFGDSVLLDRRDQEGLGCDTGPAHSHSRTGGIRFQCHANATNDSKAATTRQSATREPRPARRSDASEERSGEAYQEDEIQRARRVSQVSRPSSGAARPQSSGQAERAPFSPRLRV